MAEKTKTKAVGAGTLLALLALAYFATRAKAAPEVYVCPYCDAEFTSYEELEAHIVSEHPTEPPPAPPPEYPLEFICPYCLEAFSAWSDMQWHIWHYHPGASVPPAPPEPEPPPVEAVTIDSLEVQADYAAYRVNTKVTIANNTGGILISRPSNWIYTKLSIDAYAGERYSPILGDPPRIKELGDKICSLFSTTGTSGIGDIPPGTTIKPVSYGARDLGLQYYDRASHTNKRLPLEYGLPEGLKGYVVVHFWQLDQRPIKYIYGADVYEVFKGNFSSQGQIWTKVPFIISEEKIKHFTWGMVRYRDITLLDGSGLVLGESWWF